MAVYYNELKGSHGSLTGSIITFPVEVTDTEDPVSVINKKILPAGYIRCDGSVLAAADYPMLAIVLGTGSSCKYQKEGQPLTDLQIQIPDLRSKHIRATTSANIGDYNDLEVLDDGNNAIEKAGVGLDVIANIESPYTINYTGSFYIPPQTTPLRGEPRFTLETGSYTFTAEVPESAFQPHMHQSETLRSRQKDAGGSFFSARQRNSVRSNTTLNVCRWWENTRQDLCYWKFTGDNDFGGYPQQTQIGPTTVTMWGACFTGCQNFSSQGYCLWPDEVTCPNMVNENTATGGAQDPGAGAWNIRNNIFGDPGDCNRSNLYEMVTTYFGTGARGNGTSLTGNGGIGYSPTWTMECDCATVLGICFGGYNGHNQKNPQDGSKVLETDLQGNINVPVGRGVDSAYPDGITAVANMTTATGRQGNSGEHRHRIDLNPDDDPHTYKMVTRAATARADSGLVSKVSFTTNTSPKADKYIQPYIITEYLIKI
tara:strand:+ start:3984 stop:5435 length:1452 start_codon:yes stop_codon:yes gene_type:complete